MAIRIDRGTAPRLGRLSMPRGTFLSDQPPFSNPSTAADGSLGGQGGMNPPQVPLGNPFLPGGAGRPVWEAATNPVQTPRSNQPMFPLRDVWNAFYNSIGLDNALTPEGADKLMQPNAARAYKNLWGLTSGVSAVLQPNQTPTGALSNPTNPLVGNDIGVQPTGLSVVQVNRMFPGLSDRQRIETLQQMGYTYTYVSGTGGMWVKQGDVSGPGAPQTGQSMAQQYQTQSRSAQQSPSGIYGPTDTRGRPEWVDPTQLQRGERVTTQGGFTYVGGTPTEQGQSQYAVTIPGGVSDERYKWADTVQKDNDGNWVRVYKRVKRAQYSRQWRKKQQQRAEENRASEQAQQTVPSATVESPVAFNQLVNLRADFG